MNINETEVCELYTNGKNANEIGVIFNCSQFPIYKILHKNNIKIRSGSEIRRKYYLNESYFNNIDTPEKAYILGFIYADGCVFNSSKSSGCSIFINSKDIEIINFIKLELTDKPIETTKRGLIGLSLYSTQLANSLISKGVFQNKSIILKFPTEEQVPKHLLNHFIRGIFDGDGSVTNCCNKQMARFSTSKDLALHLKDYLLSLDINSNIFDSKKNCFYLSICSKKDFRKFFNFLYGADGFRLSRKYNKFLEILANDKFIF